MTNMVKERISSIILKPFSIYPSRIEGFENSSFNEHRRIDMAGKPLVYICQSKDGVPVAMDKSEMNNFINRTCWVAGPNGKRQPFLYWTKNNSGGYLADGYDLRLRGIERSNKYFFGARPYLFADGQKIECEYPVFGSNAGSFMFYQINTSELKKSGGEWGKFDKTTLADYLSNKGGKWDWFKIEKPTGFNEGGL